MKKTIASIKTGRIVGLERHYSCRACSAEHSSWVRLRECPSCGARMTSAVIHRAILAA